MRFHNRSSRGSALVFVLIISLILGVFAYFISTQQLFGLKKLRTYRMRMGRDRIVERLEAALSDPAFVRNSRVRVEGFKEQSRFLNCLYMGEEEGGRPEPNCEAGTDVEPKFYDFVLFSSAPIHGDPVSREGYPMDFAMADPGTSRLAGPGLKSPYVLYNTDGELCDINVSNMSPECPFELRIRFRPQCRGAEKCANATVMTISYDLNYQPESLLDRVFSIKSIHEKGEDPKKSSVFWTKVILEKFL